MSNSCLNKNWKSTPPTFTAINSFTWLMISALFITLTPSAGFPANFSITPTSLDLSNGAKSGAFSVINSGNDKLNCQIEVKEWSQDANGKDVYTEARDMVYFPKIMTVNPNEQRAIRIGVKGAPSLQERTYRLFVEEIPSPKKAIDEKSEGKITAGLTIAFRYAIPIFVRPVRQHESGSIEQVDMLKGTIRALVRNTGNIHFKLLGVTFRGKAADGNVLFSQEVAGWYVLQGLSRAYEVNVPRELCANLATIELTAQSENFNLNGTLNVHKGMCTQ